MNVYDLFSCIGGHSLGFGRAGVETVAFCEKEEWRRRIIAKHFPGVPIFEDVHTAPAIPADIYAGGPPCAGTSVAAAIQGNRDGRTLFPAMLRLVSEGAPRWVAVEQPPGNSKWEDQVTHGLESVGYHVRWVSFTASSFGLLCHRRRRYALACRDVERLEIARRSVASQVREGQRFTAERDVGAICVPRALRVGDGFPATVVGLTAEQSERVRRIRAIGDSNPPLMMEVIGRAIVAGDHCDTI